MSESVRQSLEKERWIGNQHDPGLTWSTNKL
jgi:hypothetical protein